MDTKLSYSQRMRCLADHFESTAPARSDLGSNWNFLSTRAHRCASPFALVVQTSEDSKSPPFRPGTDYENSSGEEGEEQLDDITMVQATVATRKRYILQLRT